MSRCQRKDVDFPLEALTLAPCHQNQVVESDGTVPCVFHVSTVRMPKGGSIISFASQDLFEVALGLLANKAEEALAMKH